MLNLKDDNGKLLPQEVQDRVNSFIERVKNVKWFQPDKGLKKSEITKQAKFTLECFGVKAKIEYRELKTSEDWDSARASNLDSAWVSACASACDSALDSTRTSARTYACASACASALDSAWASARASAETLIFENKDFKAKYPNGAFIQLFKLWEMGLYPVGVVGGKFIIYIPESK